MYSTFRNMEDGGGIADGGVIFNDIFCEPDRSFFGQSFQGENPPCIRNLCHVYAGKGAFRREGGGFYHSPWHHRRALLKKAVPGPYGPLCILDFGAGGEIPRLPYLGPFGFFIDAARGEGEGAPCQALTRQKWVLRLAILRFLCYDNGIL